MKKTFWSSVPPEVRHSEVLPRKSTGTCDRVCAPIVSFRNSTSALPRLLPVLLENALVLKDDFKLAVTSWRGHATVVAADVLSRGQFQPQACSSIRGWLLRPPERPGEKPAGVGYRREWEGLEGQTKSRYRTRSSASRWHLRKRIHSPMPPRLPGSLPAGGPAKMIRQAGFARRFY